ncbi:unnamed protein product [Mytilus coruscus]|uniref:Uncharacterized protein n=1 Tax=Mytilus coruscus TaxID=42192 RepID=A0A6J8ARJ3_MYTCO|nr:unnamed protein product [Mytilus coruscus]
MFRGPGPRSPVMNIHVPGGEQLSLRLGFTDFSSFAKRSYVVYILYIIFDCIYLRYHLSLAVTLNMEDDVLSLSAHGESIGDDSSSKATEHSLSAHGESIGDDSSSKTTEFSDMMVIDEIGYEDTTEEPSDNREVHDEGIYQQYVHRQKDLQGPKVPRSRILLMHPIQKKLKIIP